MLKNHVKDGIPIHIELLTFKKDRSISIDFDNGQYLIHEDGYDRKNYVIPTKKEMIKLVMKLAKFEFPRSRTLYFDLKN